MAKSIELERTFLAKAIPKEIENGSKKEIIDIYIPLSAEHPVLRLRKIGNRFEMTKKTIISSDASEQTEDTISLSEQEFLSLSKIEGKRLAKERHYCQFGKLTAEIDVYKEGLKGLVLVDFEFPSRKEKESFTMPDFCLADVTQEKAFAGGMLCGKKFKEIEPVLEKYNYKKLFLE